MLNPVPIKLGSNSNVKYLYGKWFKHTGSEFVSFDPNSTDFAHTHWFYVSNVTRRTLRILLVKETFTVVKLVSPLFYKTYVM